MPDMHRRPEVHAFALAMEAKLKAHQRKHVGCPGWKHLSQAELLEGLMGEIGELGKALAGEGPEAAALEAVDVANWCMFLWDVLTKEGR